MRVATTGSSGFVGFNLREALHARADLPVPILRSASGEGIFWDPARGLDPPDALSGIDAVVHLAGENLGAGRWTAARRHRILESRVNGTRAIVSALEAAHPRPAVAVFASAVGFYGNRGDEELDETSSGGEGFLAEVTRAWEAEANRARDIPGLRSAVLRFGVILGRQGGALAKMLPVFELGLGGPLGSGEQWLSWIHMEDAVGAILHVIDQEGGEGVFNVTSPHPVKNREFTRALGKALHRPAIMPIPSFAISLAFGRMGTETILAGQRVLPRHLLSQGFRFRFPRLEEALNDILT